MQTFTLALTDQYNVHHAAAVCVIQYATHQNTVQESHILNADEVYEATNHESSYVHYEVSFWHDLVARSVGADRIDVRPTDVTMDFRLTDDEYKGMSLIDACIHHFTTVVAPTMTGQAAE